MRSVSNNNLRASFETKGYCIVREAINETLIDKCLLHLERFKRKRSFYFSQSDHIWERSDILTEDGFLPGSIQSPSKLFLDPKLQRSVIDVISCKVISDLLSEITGFEYFIRWQDMLFDRSTGTVDHADSWYLDTYPAGGMVGAWIALEDIDERAGRFFIVPRDSVYDLPRYQDMPSHEQYVALVQACIKEKGLLRHAPAMKKGDILFWSSETIHGSFSQHETGFSRKSLTAHYHPIGYGRDKSRSPMEIKKYISKMLPTENAKIFLDNYDPSIASVRASFLRFIIKRTLGQYHPRAVTMSREKLLRKDEQ